jgi:hypothetical protein
MLRMDATDDRVAAIAGVVHGGYGALVEVVADALDEGLWKQAGIHSPAHWLSWKSGLSMRRARHVVLVAGRRAELPSAVAALTSGELSLDQVQVIAAHVPAPYEDAATELARVLTAAQLERTLPAYRFDDEPEPPPSDGPEADGADAEGNDDGDTPAEGDVGDAAADGDAGDDRRPGATDLTGADGLGAGHDRGGFGGFGGFGPGPEEKRRASWSWDDQGMGRLSACLPTDEALVFEAAWQAARADLLAQRRGELPDGAAVPWISGPDVLLHLARTYLDHGRERRPGADRYLVHTHLDHHPDGQPVLHRHLGPVLPDALRRYLGCDADARPVWAVEGVAVSVGRRERLVPDRTRRLVGQRDGGCIVPGCDRRWGLDVHHVTHWEDLGRTDTDNLCCLCRTHHRQHHLGLLGIAGNADEPGGLRVTDRWGRAMEPAGCPDPIDPERSIQRTADERGTSSDPYVPATGERLDRWGVHLQRRPRHPDRGADPPETPVLGAPRDPRGDDLPAVEPISGPDP